MIEFPVGLDVVEPQRPRQICSQHLPLLCQESRATYALLWTLGSGRLCVSAAYACDKKSRAFAEASCSVMISPGEGCVGRVLEDQVEESLQLANQKKTFLRADLAQVHGIHSFLFVPWCKGAVIELGSCDRWSPPLILNRQSPRVAAAIKDAPEMGGQVWEAVLWKRSAFLRKWRQRHIRLLNRGEFYELTTWDVWKGRVTGTWKLAKQLPYIEVSSNFGFMAVMELDGIALAALTDAGVAAMEDLAIIFNGRLMRQGVGCGKDLRVATRPVRSMSDSTTADEDCSISRFSDKELETDLLSFCSPPCDDCCKGAVGRLIIHPKGCEEMGRWLCASCFSAAWMPACIDDGRLQKQPQWMALTPKQTLVDATPPAHRRYSRVCR
eukprot:TRINITY_DN51845_c0_g1_i1.p1 TRINITY_DN51845_c0_g1~~TRINITY_DN51845_c0_g1_i1.p1  ORF type:complete len:397 (+),score=76.71 TRINITY_DN51845_c0_g1_i1:47-1192(+)